MINGIELNSISTLRQSIRTNVCNSRFIVLINGGDKSKQSNDIEKANKLLKQWRTENE